MILSSTIKERKAALNKLFRHVKKDIKATLKVMSGLPVTFRLLDPPLHEFIPQDQEKRRELARSLGISVNEVKKRGDLLHEINPMMGHRGVRLGITYPEVTEMQVRAIFEAAAEVNTEKMDALRDMNELTAQKEIVERVYREVLEKFKIKKIHYLLGTMIEIPRACLLADRMANEAEFFSFGTNDLTQMGFGFSRDDIGGFLGEYLEKKILKADPFQTIDQDGIGQLIDMGVNKGRSTNPKLKVGICGEQGGDPASVEFCYKVGMNYVSCSPYRVPIARLAAAHASIEAKNTSEKTSKNKKRKKQ